MSDYQSPATIENKGNKLFPVFLKLDQLHVLIVGGGFIGLEKITAILNNSPATKITLVAGRVLPEVAGLKSKLKNLTIIERDFEVHDLDNKDLVIAATGVRSVSELLRKEATARKILINVADTPDLCDFYLGSIVQKGDLKIAISTNGKSPTLAKRLKEIFSEELKEEDIQNTLDNLQQFRNHLKGDFSNKIKQLNEITSMMNEKKNKDENSSL
jgi:siroheme synthase-like protein